MAFGATEARPRILRLSLERSAQEDKHLWRLRHFDTGFAIPLKPTAGLNGAPGSSALPQDDSWDFMRRLLWMTG